MIENVSVGFIGFGEAGFEIAKGLRSEGVRRMFLYDIAHTDLLENRAAETGVEVTRGLKALAENSDWILSVVPPGVSLEVSRKLLGHLQPGQFYLDLTSSFPEDMKSAAAMVKASGAHFVDGAMMGALPVHGHKVLIYVAGNQAETVARRLNAIGMNVKAVGREAGQASAVKLILSVATKGFGSLLAEMLLASHYFDVDDAVLEALELFYTKGLRAYIDRSVGSSAIYAGRRVVEMEASAKLLEQIGVDPIMTAATVARLKWLDSLELPAFFKGKVPGGYREVLAAWEEMGLFAKMPKRTSSG
ncbi:MAG: NAD(P)-dependent oxidoreductase [Deltaproteobacteria bacterium]|jgi:3-hydroxyisobutyrate dehydrogenase-like beta-hydroxyacid dehydrogenase|nr:NAD(P)-dependent oxidoreductase [Deltaproteobacteria bacterium]